MVLVLLVWWIDGGFNMAFFLKQTLIKGRTYLAIYESHYDHGRKGTVHKCIKSLKSIETHLANGISDPVSLFQQEVDAMNKARIDKGVPKISGVSPILHLGYFPLKSIMNRLKIKKYVDYFKFSSNFAFDLYELLSSLIYARCVNPCSKSKTFHEVLPSLYEPYNYSYDQLLDGLSYLGANYLKFTEIFSVCTSEVYGVDISKTYFDCTNFYFEIDREDDFRKDGPSKENKKCPIIGLGLLLDKNQIPIGMEMYPGNESEKPVLRRVADKLKKRYNISGRTVHVADKGLNCTDNILFAKKNGDGYLFSKSVKMLPAMEKEWILEDSLAFKSVKDQSGNLLYRYKSRVDKFPYATEHEGKRVTVMLTEKRLLTYNPDLAAKKRYEINRMVEKAKKLTLSGAKKKEYGETGKYVSFTDDKGEKAKVCLNQAAIDKDLMFAGYNLIVTSETRMKDEDIYAVYHNLWRIEESFRIMKSDLDARPVFLRKEETIKGHFLICYLTVLLERLFQFKVLESKFSASEIFRLFRGFNLTKGENKYINTAIDSRLIKELTEKTGLPLQNYFLSETQIKSILNYRL